MKTVFCRLLAASLFCVSAVFSFAQSPTVLIAGLQSPESIISDGKYYYVSCIGKKLEPLAKDGDGCIVKLLPDGTVVSRNFVSTALHAPKGLAILQHRLYVTDIDRLLGFDLSTGKEVLSLDFLSLGVTFLNDLAVKNDSVLFVSATDKGHVFEVTVGTEPTIQAVPIPMVNGANGIEYDSITKRLYIAGMGSFSAARGEGILGYADWKTGHAVYHMLKGTTGFFDGIALPDSTHILVSDWVNFSERVGVIKKLNIKTGAVTTVTKTPIGGPADFYYEATKKRLLIPATLTGDIIVLPL